MSRLLHAALCLALRLAPTSWLRARHTALIERKGAALKDLEKRLGLLMETHPAAKAARGEIHRRFNTALTPVYRELQRREVLRHV